MSFRLRLSYLITQLIKKTTIITSSVGWMTGLETTLDGCMIAESSRDKTVQFGFNHLERWESMIVWFSGTSRSTKWDCSEF